MPSNFTLISVVYHVDINNERQITPKAILGQITSGYGHSVLAKEQPIAPGPARSCWLMFTLGIESGHRCDLCNHLKLSLPKLHLLHRSHAQNNIDAMWITRELDSRP